MKKIISLFFILALYSYAFATPSNTLSIIPVAVDATTITASDENTRNNTIVSIYNAHSHSDISQFGNNLNIGDSLAGNKTIFFYNADSNKPFLRYDDTNDYWVLSTNGVASSIVLQGSGLIFEGATDNDYETTFSITEPTADRTITFPNSDINFVTGLPVANGGTGSTTASGARSNLGAAASGANSDITSLSGLTTALTTGQGGTGSTAAANAANGVVVPTGAVNAANGVVVPTGAVNAANGAAVLDASGYLPNNSCDTTALKTTTGEVSSAAGQWSNLTLPGGEYGFYPQFKAATAGGGSVATFYENGQGTMGTSYVSHLTMTNNSYTCYVQQRYVTASGKDHWLFLLVNKVAKEIVSAYSAPDHPAYGNGGDFDKLFHPFGNYDKDKYEIVLVDNDTVTELKTQVTEEKSLLTLINELYKPNMDKEEVYKPLHSGKFLGEEPELVQNIPNYIKVRKLIKLNVQELQEKENERQLIKQKADQDKTIKEQNRINAKNKLKVLGLTKDEIEALK